MKSHYHICGDIGMNSYKFDPARGCGHVYRHTKSKTHKCPKCGKFVNTAIPTKEEITNHKNLITCM